MEFTFQDWKLEEFVFCEAGIQIYMDIFTYFYAVKSYVDIFRLYFDSALV